MSARDVDLVFQYRFRVRNANGLGGVWSRWVDCDSLKERELCRGNPPAESGFQFRTMRVLTCTPDPHSASEVDHG